MRNKKAYEEIMGLLTETCGLDNMLIVHDKVMDSYKSSDVDDEGNWIKAEMRNSKSNPRTEFDSYEMAIMYDGGMMYSIMSCEYGYESKDRFMEKLDVILKKHKLGYEEYDNVTMVIYKD